MKLIVIYGINLNIFLIINTYICYVIYEQILCNDKQIQNFIIHFNLRKKKIR